MENEENDEKWDLLRCILDRYDIHPETVNYIIKDLIAEQGL